MSEQSSFGGDGQPIRYAIVGLGRAGWEIHVNQLRGRPDARITAVADPLAERRDQAVAEFECRAYDSLAKLLKKSDDIDVVVIATPSAHHAADTKRCFKAGRHVVVEKPMAASVAEAESMVRAADDAGRQLFVHQNYRFFPEFTYMRDVVRGDVIGGVYHVRNYLSQFFRRDDWQTLAKNGGGLLNNWGAHFIDQILQLIDSPLVQACGDLQQIASAGDVEDHVKAFLRFENGATADVEISNAQNVAVPLPKWILCGTHGTLTCDGQRFTLRWFDPAAAPPLTVREGAAKDRKYGNDDKLAWQEKVTDVQPRVRGAFYDNVYAVLRKDEPMYVTPQSAIDVMRTIAMIRKGTKFPGKAPRARTTASPESAGAV